MAFTNNIDWHEMHQLRIVEESACWEKCKTSACCTNLHQDFNFIGTKQNACSMYYIDDEYEYFLSKNLASTKIAGEFHIPLNNHADLRIVKVTCKLQGKCANIYGKPLACKIYPFLPIIKKTDNNKLIIDSLRTFSTFDASMKYAGSESDCYILKELEDKYLTIWQDKLSKLIANDRLVLYIKAMQFFLEDLEEHIENNLLLKAIQKKKFWFRWETLLASGQLTDLEKITQKLEQW